MKRYMILIAVLISVLTAGTSLTSATGSRLQRNKKSQKQEKLASEAKITMEQARETALKHTPGTVESGELEREHGQLVYSFDIRTDEKNITEVQVSAINGEVVRVEHETKQQEAAEKKKEKKSRKP